MSASSYRDPRPQLDTKARAVRSEAADFADPFSEKYREIMKEQWQAKLLCLQGWICELLIKNQQLRMALMEIKSRETEDKSGRST
jgi:hypothetical protein